MARADQVREDRGAMPPGIASAGAATPESEAIAGRVADTEISQPTVLRSVVKELQATDVWWNCGRGQNAIHGPCEITAPDRMIIGEGDKVRLPSAYRRAIGRQGPNHLVLMEKHASTLHNAVGHPLGPPLEKFEHYDDPWRNYVTDLEEAQARNPKKIKEAPKEA